MEEEKKVFADITNDLEERGSSWISWRALNAMTSVLIRAEEKKTQTQHRRLHGDRGRGWSVQPQRMPGATEAGIQGQGRILSQSLWRERSPVDLFVLDFQTPERRESKLPWF